MKIGKVYKIIHKDSDAIYVGSTIQSLKIRFRDHRNRNLVIGEYIKKYGVDRFEIILLNTYQICDIKHLHAYEQLWLNKLRKHCINKQEVIDFLCGRCAHKSDRKWCKTCNGSALCEEHGIEKFTCKKCKGGGICYHKKRRTRCKKCTPVECDTCFQIYSKEMIINHKKTHLENYNQCECNNNIRKIKFQCKICSPVKCEICSNIYSNQGIINHLKSHYDTTSVKREKSHILCDDHNKRKNRCKICSPVKCEICKKIYSKDTIKAHLKTHLST